MFKLFIDGSEGTTGLRIRERLRGRSDIEMLNISSELRKDYDERKRLLCEADIAILCLPDDAAREAVAIVDEAGADTRIIDASTAHRTEPGWVYGFPELRDADGTRLRERIRSSSRVAVPGCYASGMVSLVRPLTAAQILPPSAPVAAFAVSGYSGGGRKMIQAYEAEKWPDDLDAPRFYALGQSHKHIREMKAIGGLDHEPLFAPAVCAFYSGMIVTVPIDSTELSGQYTPADIWRVYADYYNRDGLVRLRSYGAEGDEQGFLAANALTGKDYMELFVTGSHGRIQLVSRFDNLGKGASGAAVQCLNIMTGVSETQGLVID